MDLNTIPVICIKILLGRSEIYFESVGIYFGAWERYFGFENILWSGGIYFVGRIFCGPDIWRVEYLVGRISCGSDILVNSFQQNG